MKYKILLIGALLGPLTACGASEGSEETTPKAEKIVLTSNGADPMTYKDVKDQAASGLITESGMSCVEFAAFGAQNKGAKFPAGESMFIEACEEGVKASEAS